MVTIELSLCCCFFLHLGDKMEDNNIIISEGDYLHSSSHGDDSKKLIYEVNDINRKHLIDDIEVLKFFGSPFFRLHLGTDSIIFKKSSNNEKIIQATEKFISLKRAAEKREDQSYDGVDLYIPGEKDGYDQIREDMKALSELDSVKGLFTHIDDSKVIIVPVFDKKDKHSSQSHSPS